MIALGAWASSKERWSFWNGVYYSFVTLTTIGFGDFILEPSEAAICDTFMFIIFGLAVVGAAIDVLTHPNAQKLSQADDAAQRVVVRGARLVRSASVAEGFEKARRRASSVITRRKSSVLDRRKSSVPDRRRQSAAADLEKNAGSDVL